MTGKIQPTLLTAYSAKDSDDLKKAQTNKVAQLFSDFVGKAQQSIHIAIYDFRLSEPEGHVVIDALSNAAQSGIDVRVAYFQPDPKKKRKSSADFSPDGGDPAPDPDKDFRKRFHKDVQFKPIQGIDINNLPPDERLPIEGGGHLMHSKYIIRDGLAVWMGSANFTTDAWSIQDNNIVILESQDIADNYETDFAELWEAERIAGTGKNDHGETNIDEVDVEVDFAPGDGAAMDQCIANQISTANSEVLLASMVISSGAVLGALVDAIERGVNVWGIYDGPEMNNVIKDWGKSKYGTGDAKIAQWNVVKNNLVAKHSTPYSEGGHHDFMHNKVLVVDQQTVVTGSYNFSQNATHNAENMITLYDNGIAAEYEEYIKGLVSKYS